MVADALLDPIPFVDFFAEPSMLPRACPTEAIFAMLALAAAVAIYFKLLPAGMLYTISFVMIVLPFTFPLIPVVLGILCWLRGLPNET